MKKNNWLLASIFIGMTFFACTNDNSTDNQNDNDSTNVTERVAFINSTPEEFAQTLIGAFRTNDVDLFKKLAIDKDELIEHISKSVTNDSIKEQLIKGVQGNEGLWKALSFTDGTFKSLINEGTKLGVKWDKAKFEQFNSNIHEIEAIKQADGKVIFTSEGKKYEFMILDCRELDGGWFGMGLQVEEAMTLQE